MTRVAFAVFALLLWGDLSNSFTLLSLFTVISFGTLGAIDDWTKFSTSRNGMRGRQKILVQIVLAAFTVGFLYRELSQIPRGLELIWPIGGGSLFLGIGFIAWATFVMVGSSNAPAAAVRAVPIIGAAAA